MNYKSFPEHFWSDIQSTIHALKSENKPLIAAFDADGTLWDTDLGENFFNFQIDNKLVPLPPEPWTHYLEMKKINDDPRDAYIWLAQINNGISLDTVRKWAQEAFESIKPRPIFSEQEKLINLFLENSINVYIVTASIKWAVEPGARALGLKNENVIGVETLIENNMITDKRVLPITYKDGKVSALLKKTGNAYPFFSCGNTTGDYELLKCSTNLKLAVSAASRDDKLFKSEDELMNLAIKHNWWRHRFI